MILHWQDSIYFLYIILLYVFVYCYVLGHSDKPNIVKYHPTAFGVLASSALDLTVKIWDINKARDVITLTGLTEQVGNNICYVCHYSGQVLIKVAFD